MSLKILNKNCTWVNGLEALQSAYCSKLAGIISSLKILDMLVHHQNTTDGVVTITLDVKTSMDRSRGDWPFSINQKCFDNLQVMQFWIKLSTLTFHSRYNKGHKTDKVEYNK